MEKLREGGSLLNWLDSAEQTFDFTLDAYYFRRLDTRGDSNVTQKNGINFGYNMILI